MTQTIQELIVDGKTEQESIELAISRFGGKNQIQDELAQVFSIQKKFGNVMLVVALIFLTVGISFLIVQNVAQKYTDQRGNIFFSQYDHIVNVAKENNLNLTLLDKVVRDSFNTTNNQLTYVALIRLPDDYDIEKGIPDLQPMPLDKIEYKYPEDFQKLRERGMNRVNSFALNGGKYNLEIGMQKDTYSNRFDVLFIVGIGFIMVYWVLFGIWATVKAYHVRRLNAAWIAIFFVLNVPGYLLYKIFITGSK